MCIRDSHYGNDYAFALMLVAVTVAIIIAALTWFGVEAKDVTFGRGRLRAAAPPPEKSAA